MSEYGEVVDAATVRVERLLPGPIDRVWTYLTDVGKRATWLAGGLLEQHAGGRVDHVFRIHELTGEGEPGDIADRHHGEILAWDPPHLLRHTWSSGGDLADSVVTYTLEPVRDKVRLVVTHSRLPSRDEMVGVASGWHTHLDILVARLEEREPERFWPKITALREEYDATLP